MTGLIGLALTGAGQADPLFVDAAGIVPGLAVEMRYAGSDNFVGRPIAGYEAPRCLLTPQAAQALARVQADLAPEGLGLKVFDCYRPVRAVADFAAWARDPADARMKPAYYPRTDKADLFRLGYIAERSAHSRGSTVDLTLVRLADGSELDMGTPFDLFDEASASDSGRVGPAARANRRRLRTAMIRAGFAPYPQEWWHFTLKDEPFPATAFDRPVR
ncbi:M15 family metallopeptidase [Methylorubrum salsuginis]|uniref:D-alanyl-D-alanine dipeptidase n=1 Tax=Methylorubrum salsuginis TaxID=414703 RepID=A0A1I4BQZ4_9HYPH|nr:M15 family metallopeptidase [Methylorubrum salsuginis]SFK70396.1 D-alanyl-D-alanine dipeptidase [Methylorubrum salsuginis]